jgi:hypothetical protein
MRLNLVEDQSLTPNPLEPCTPHQLCGESEGWACQSSVTFLDEEPHITQFAWPCNACIHAVLHPLHCTKRLGDAEGLIPRLISVS